MSENLATLARSALGQSAANDATPVTQSGSSSVADVVFRVMFGFYGQLWLQKFSNGAVTADGADEGVLAAKRIWAHGLTGFDADTVKAALRRCMDDHQQFPPNLPQFVALCRAVAPRAPVRLALPVSAKVLAERSRPHRERLAQLRESMAAKVALGAHPLGPLFEAMCDAVKTAGGDEARELRRLEAMFTPRRAAGGTA